MGTGPRRPRGRPRPSGWSVARTARTVTQRLAVGGREGGRGDGGGFAGTHLGTSSWPEMTATPSVSRDHSKVRWERSRTSWRLAIRMPPPGSSVMRTGSTTFLSSARPGDGVRSGNRRPSATKLPSWSGLAEVAAVGEEFARRRRCGCAGRGRSTPRRSRPRSGGGARTAPGTPRGRRARCPWRGRTRRGRTAWSGAGRPARGRPGAAPGGGRSGRPRRGSGTCGCRRRRRALDRSPS